MSSQFPDLGTTAPTVSAETLKDRLDGGESVTVLDTRRPDDFEEWRIEHPSVRTVNVPFYEFLDYQDEPVDRIPDGVPEGALVVNCAIGVSSQFVGDFLAREGRKAEVLEDGMEGWARLLEAIPLDVEAPAEVIQYHRPSSGCLGYLVLDGEEAVVVDPLRAFAERYVDDATERGAEIAAAVDTHVHADHVSGTRRVAELAGAKVLVPEGARERGLAYDDYETVGDGDELEAGTATVEVVALPGHTTETVGYRVGDVLLCGDTLFTDGVARPDLEKGAEGAPKAAGQLYDTLQGIADMPAWTVIAPGHTSTPDPSAADGSYTTTVREVTDRLVTFEMDRSAFVDHVTERIPPRPNNYERIIQVNLGRETAAESDAFQLELGPNNCAAGE
jgi:glyoxylase-like metal-dependent hydrolase (beta-lactamase superfamily II)/rhodanese-related sulfurtransferase